MQNENFARLKNCMRRAEKGETLTIGFFGGSVTQGCAATVHEKCYAYRVFDWWRHVFLPKRRHRGNGLPFWSFQSLAGFFDVPAGCRGAGFQRQ